MRNKKNTLMHLRKFLSESLWVLQRFFSSFYSRFTSLILFQTFIRSKFHPSWFLNNSCWLRGRLAMSIRGRSQESFDFKKGNDPLKKMNSAVKIRLKLLVKMYTVSNRTHWIFILMPKLLDLFIKKSGFSRFYKIIYASDLQVQSCPYGQS